MASIHFNRSDGFEFQIFVKAGNLPIIHLFETYCKKSGKKRIGQLIKALNLYFDQIEKEDKKLLERCWEQVKKEIKKSKIYEE